MQGLIDLTQRQAARVLEQALRTQAHVQIEPRLDDASITGFFAGREGDLLRINVHDRGRDCPLVPLVGAFCEVSTVLSGQMYRFSTCIVTADEAAAPQHLLLAAPTAIQVCNRRRYDRRSFSEPPVIQLFSEQEPNPLIGVLAEVGFGGLACHLPVKADEELLIDDLVRLRFQLPGAGQFFELPARVCLKNVLPSGDDVLVGLEFCPDVNRPDLARLRQALAQEYTGPARTEDEG